MKWKILFCFAFTKSSNFDKILDCRKTLNGIQLKLLLLAAYSNKNKRYLCNTSLVLIHFDLVFYF